MRPIINPDSRQRRHGWQGQTAYEAQQCISTCDEAQARGEAGARRAAKRDPEGA
jgi:hypothetical protein